MWLSEYTRRASIAPSYAEIKEFMGQNVFNYLPEWESYPNLKQHQAYLVDTFDLMYDCKQIAYKIYGQFERYLKLKFRRIAPIYEVAYEKYNMDKDKLLTVGGLTTRDYEELRTLSNTTSGNVTGNSTSNYFDTPKELTPSLLNKPSNISTSNTTSDNTSSYKDDENRNLTETVATTSENYILELNKLIDNYRNLDTNFVDEFSDLFLNIYVIR